MKRLALLLLPCLLLGCVLHQKSAGSLDGLSAAHPEDARALAMAAADELQERQAPAHTPLALGKAPGMFGEALESELRGRGFAVVLPEDDTTALGVTYTADMTDGQAYVQVSCGDGQRFSFTRPLGAPVQVTITEPPDTRPLPQEHTLESRNLPAPQAATPEKGMEAPATPVAASPSVQPQAAGTAPARPARMAKVKTTATALAVAQRNGVPVKDFCRWNGVGTSAVLEEGYQVYLSEPPAGTIPTAAPVPVPPGAAALEAQAMQTEPTAAASMPQAIPVPAQTVLPTTAQTSPKLSLEKPNPGEMTHYVPSAPLPAPVPAIAEEVSAEPPAVIETVSVSAEPVSLPTWQVERGRMLREQMENWAAQAGYTLIWSAQNDYEMQSSATFSGVFIEAVKNLFAALASNGLALRVTIYQGNNVMEVSEH